MSFLQFLLKDPRNESSRNGIMVFISVINLFMIFILIISTCLLSRTISRVSSNPIKVRTKISEEKIGKYLSVEAYSENAAVTSGEYLGFTSTGGAPFLAQTNKIQTIVPTGTSSSSIYNLPQPIETSLSQPKDHKAPKDRNIFELFGTISPYYSPKDRDFGIPELGLPRHDIKCEIKQIHLLSRHGTRYNTYNPSLAAEFLIDNKEELIKYSKLLSDILSEWKFDQGVAILTSLGNQQLFDKGVQMFFRYGKLYFDNAKKNEKVFVRSTTQERMTMSSEYFLLGFFGVDWKNFADLQLIIEHDGFNNSLATYKNCPALKNYNFKELPDEIVKFREKYLKDAIRRFNDFSDSHRISKSSNLNFNSSVLFSLQELCSYESVTLGYSPFCELFTQKEWEDYEYLNSWIWYNQNFFGAPTARALGISWVEEFKLRLHNNTNEGFEYHQALQNSSIPFPLNGSLYFDFTHDSIITNIFAALGLQQFKSNFTGDGSQQPFDLSRVVPFASQTVFEIIECGSEFYREVVNDEILIKKDSKPRKTPQKYIHMMLNDHTLDLHLNIPDYCEKRLDGWCKLDSFLDYLETLWDKADFEKSCFLGNYKWQNIVSEGVPE